jgi:hypothetical protein
MKEILDIVIPSGPVILGAFLVFLIPYFLSNLNQKLHDIGDPSWKKNEEKQGEE